jgi:arsenate reductase
MQLYHNPRCRKSRETLAFLKEQGIEPQIIEYLKTPPDFQTLKLIIEKLGIKPFDLIRKKEAEFTENYKGQNLTDDQYIEAMVKFPKLIERPIAITEKGAAIGRPMENVLKLI